MEVVLLRGGGHIAELRFVAPNAPSINCLWAAPWLTVDPDHQNARDVAGKYGSSPAGPFLAGYTGHAICLDNFGPPSAGEADLGVPLHGEASARMWKFEPTANGCVGRVGLPVSQLSFERSIGLANDSSMMFVEERVYNQGGSDREIHWVQHVTFGPPFLAPGQSCIHAPLDHAMTWPLGYEGRELLRDNAVFEWPMAPSIGVGSINLEIPFQGRNSGFVVAARTRPEKAIAYIAALNWNLGLVLLYCFRRKDFPWVAIWEENCARFDAPWNGVTQARGMEFGTTPMPLGRDAVHAMGNLFDTEGSRVIPTGGRDHARYLVCIAQVPKAWRNITNIQLSMNSLKFTGPQNGEDVAVAATGADDFLLKGLDQK